MSSGAGRRGLLIVLEGCDRSGKTTLCKRLVEELDAREGVSCRGMRFPDRATRLGGFLDGYLRGETRLGDQTVHLLFSANRWEKVDEMREQLAGGVNLVVDRYAFSGVAFSSAKEGMDLEWCKNPDRGLPEPDLVCFLDVSPEEARKRGGFGQEIYEKEEFQARVRSRYAELMAGAGWKLVDTDGKTLEQVYGELLAAVETALKGDQGGRALGKLWLDDGGDRNHVTAQGDTNGHQ